MVRLTNCLNMTIAVDRDVKPRTKDTQNNTDCFRIPPIIADNVSCLSIEQVYSDTQTKHTVGFIKTEHHWPASGTTLQ